MDRNIQGFTAGDLKQILAACWDVGAPNLRALSNDLPLVISKARQHYIDTDQMDKDDNHHPVIRLYLGHMSFLAGLSLGPDEADVEFTRGMLAELQEGVEA